MDNDFPILLESYLVSVEESYGSDLKREIKYSPYRLQLIEISKEIKKLYKDARKDRKNADKWKILLEKYQNAIVLANKFKDHIDSLPEPTTRWQELSQYFAIIFDWRFPTSDEDSLVYLDDKAINSKSVMKRDYQKAMNVFIVNCGREIHSIKSILASL